MWKDYWTEKFTFRINAHTLIEKQSNQDWNTPIHLKDNGPHIKVPLIFRFLTLIFYLYFYCQLWVKWVCIHTGNNPGHIGQTHSRFPNICGCLTLNKMHIKYTSLVVCLINDNLNKTSSTRPSEGKKTGLYIPYLIILCTSTETSIY